MEYKTCESAPLGGALSREIPCIGVVLLAAGQSRRMGIRLVVKFVALFNVDR